MVILNLQNSQENKMKISIITPTYNSAQTLSDTIESIIDQNYSDLEYIIIDGKSKDNTVEIVNNYKDRLNITLISEPDDGIYDAMNKGIKMATGEIIGIINADDFYHNNKVLKQIKDAFSNDNKIDAVYGDLVYIDKNDKTKIVRNWKAGSYSENKLNSGWIIPHPTFFVRKSVYKRIDKIFDTEFTISADYELILRLLKIEKINVKYIPQNLVFMRTGGTSSKNIQNKKVGWQELKDSWTKNNLKLPRFFIVRRVLGKIKQIIN
jgi:glycosyltransferase involved in cell wall biosynthesis